MGFERVAEESRIVGGMSGVGYILINHDQLLCFHVTAYITLVRLVGNGDREGGTS